MKKIIILLFALFLLLPQAASAAKPQIPYNLFAISGQSNGVGRMPPLPIVEQETNPRVIALLPDETWRIAAEPVALYAFGRSDLGYSPSLAFARRILQYKPAYYKIALINCAVPSTPISAWQRGQPAYDDCLRYISAQNNAVLSGVLFIQGETDAMNLETAEAWAANFSRFVADFRQDTGVSDLPFIVPELGAPPSAYFPYWQNVIDQMRSVNIPGVGFFATADLEKWDEVHYTGAAQEILGERAADAIIPYTR